MLNAFCKSMLAGSLSIMILSGCSDNSKAARELLSQAESMAVSGDYPGALALLDSVDSRYAAEVEVRRRHEPSPSHNGNVNAQRAVDG